MTHHALGDQGTWRRLLANRGVTARLLNLFRGATTGRPKYQSGIARMLSMDPQMRRFLDGEMRAIPPFFEARIRNDLGPLRDALPPGALD